MSYQSILPNTESIVERKLKAEYGKIIVDVPFYVYDGYARAAQDMLQEIHDVNKDLHSIMENSLMQTTFERVLSAVSSELLKQHMRYESPDSMALSLMFKDDIDAAKQAREEFEAETKRLAIEKDETRRAQERLLKVSIEIPKENETKVRALLQIAGLA